MNVRLLTSVSVKRHRLMKCLSPSPRAKRPWNQCVRFDCFLFHGGWAGIRICHRLLCDPIVPGGDRSRHVPKGRRRKLAAAVYGELSVLGNYLDDEDPSVYAVEPSADRADPNNMAARLPIVISRAVQSQHESNNISSPLIIGAHTIVRVRRLCSAASCRY
jgi:hypothetical protein